MHFSRQKNDGFFPYNTTLLIAHVVNLIKHDPSDFTHELRSAIQHGPQNFGRHDET